MEIWSEKGEETEQRGRRGRFEEFFLKRQRGHFESRKEVVCCVETSFTDHSIPRFHKRKRCVFNVHFTRMWKLRYPLPDKVLAWTLLQLNLFFLLSPLSLLLSSSLHLRSFCFLLLFSFRRNPLSASHSLLVLIKWSEQMKLQTSLFTRFSYEYFIHFLLPWLLSESVIRFAWQKVQSSRKRKRR